MKKMIGIYDYTVILTYLGLVSSLLGMINAANGWLLGALLFLGGALFCDTADGKVARAKKNRTEAQKQFGIQIDSLCDVISFGVFPAVLCIQMGLNTLFDYPLLACYCLCCVIRLAYFNVLAQNEQKDSHTVYHGLPVVGFSVFLPAAYLAGSFLPAGGLAWMLRVLLVVFGLLYILDFPVKKPGTWQLAVIATFFLVPLTVIWILG